MRTTFLLLFKSPFLFLFLCLFLLLLVPSLQGFETLVRVFLSDIDRYLPALQRKMRTVLNGCPRCEEKGRG